MLCARYEAREYIFERVLMVSDDGLESAAWENDWLQSGWVGTPHCCMALC